MALTYWYFKTYIQTYIISKNIVHIRKCTKDVHLSVSCLRLFILIEIKKTSHPTFF